MRSLEMLDIGADGDLLAGARATLVLGEGAAALAQKLQNVTPSTSRIFKSTLGT
jgi:hypothetical protein